MSDRVDRVMSTEAQAAEQHAARTADRIGDPDKLDPATFASFGVAERMHLFKTNPDRYRELQGELDKATDLTNLGGGR